MSKFELITTVLSVLAIGISVWSLFVSRKTSSAQIELVINERITTTKAEVSSVLLQSLPYITEAVERMDAIQLVSNSAIESNLNAYEEACGKYLDNKIDRKRFKKNYHKEIRQLVERPDLRSYFDPTTSSYKAILKVYKDWNDLEK